MRKLFYNSYVTSYRVIGAGALYLLIAGFIAYNVTVGFYYFNHTWVAPLLIAPSNDRVLAMTAQIVASQDTLNTLTLTNKNLEKSKVEMLDRRKKLVALAAQLDAALARATDSNLINGSKLAKLAEQKHQDIANTQNMLVDIEKTRAGIERDLKAGLITKAEAVTQETGLTQFANSLTDQQVGEVVLNDSIRTKTTMDLSAVDTMSKQIELRSELSQLDVQISSGDDTIKNNTVQIDTIQKAIQATTDNPYYLATKAQQALQFAFVPYDNDNDVKVGAPVFDCKLSFVWCHEVGTVQRVFSEEEHAIHPLKKIDVRGFFVQLNLNEGIAAKSKTLFINNKPLLF